MLQILRAVFKGYILLLGASFVGYLLLRLLPLVWRPRDEEGEVRQFVLFTFVRYPLEALIDVLLWPIQRVLGKEPGWWMDE